MSRVNPDTVIRVAGVQCAPVLGEPARNLAMIRDLTADAARGGADLVVFPECALTGYCFESPEEARSVAEPVPGPACEAVLACCRDHGVHVAFGLLETDGAALFNAAVLAGPGGVAATYRKVHIPCIGADCFTTPGNRPFTVHDTPLGRVALNICYDFAFPEAARCLMLQDVELVILITNWPSGAELPAEYMPVVRAMENRIFYVAVDRVGEERGFRFIGRSQIIGIDGDILAAAGPDDETIIYADITPAAAREKLIVRVPGRHSIHRVDDRRPDMYAALTAPVRRPDTAA